MPVPASDGLSDTKAGSVLVYPVYSSSSFQPSGENTRINITNTNDSSSVTIHLFFVDGTTCAPADSFACLTPQQTLSFLASDYDPNTLGYLVAVAVDSNGCPVSFNYLIGDAYVKLLTGHAANYGAEAFAARYVGRMPGSSPADLAATLQFDGGASGYNQPPRTVAVDGLLNPLDGSSDLLYVMRLGGNLSAGAGGKIGLISGLLFDDTERAFSFVTFFGQNACQFQAIISNNFPRTTPRFSQVIRRGRTGWMKLTPNEPVGILGVILTSKFPDPPAGRNVHRLTTTADTLVIPIFQAPC